MTVVQEETVGDFIYTISVIHWRGHSCTTGWYKTEEEAKACVVQNVDALFECGYYQYAVVEKYPCGGHVLPECAWWFEAEWDVDKQTHQISEINKPLMFQNIIGFAMG
jgi:hypothetical protein